MPVIKTKGAASSQGFGEFAKSGAATYIEDVFSTYLYTGTGAAQTITNNIDLSTKGGMVWQKSRSAAGQNFIFDTARGALQYLASNSTNASANYNESLTAFNANGFNLGFNLSNSGETDVTWTFRKQAKFFDIVTWTGSGTPGRTISHSLGSVPGCIMVKCTSTTYSWFVYHKDASAGGATTALALNSTAAATNEGNAGIQNLTSTTFQLGGSGAYSTRLDDPSATYVAYIYASNAGGFGLTGTDNVITCGTFTTDGSGNATINLGYEPQWILVKVSSAAAYNWLLLDTMRGMPIGSSSRLLQPNLSDAETTSNGWTLTATGFTLTASISSQTFIYIAIRRGPMKVPTTGTSVFGTNARTGTGANATVTGGQTDDAVLVKNRGSAVASLFSSRLTGTGYLVTSTTAAEVAAGVTILQANPWDVMDGVKVGTTSTITNASSNTYINYLFKRAPSFMDVVCYTGNGASSQVLTHNLTVTPQLTIFKKRSAANPWDVVYGNTSYLQLNDTLQAFPDTSIAATATTITAPLGAGNGLNASGATYVAYLFATCAGVSKVGSYTGNGTTQTIDCGLTAGARFVLIKRTDAVGDWYVYDTARGMTTLTDPYLLTNTTAAEVATLGSVTTVATGFAVNSAILAAINTNAATYIFLAVA